MMDKSKNPVDDYLRPLVPSMDVRVAIEMGLQHVQEVFAAIERFWRNQGLHGSAADFFDSVLRRGPDRVNFTKYLQEVEDGDTAERLKFCRQAFLMARAAKSSFNSGRMSVGWALVFGASYSVGKASGPNKARHMAKMKHKNTDKMHAVVIEHYRKTGSAFKYKSHFVKAFTGAEINGVMIAVEPRTVESWLIGITPDPAQ